VATNPISIAGPSVVITTETYAPSDGSWSDSRDYVQVLMTSSNKPDVVSYHGYGGFQGNGDTEQSMLDYVDNPSNPDAIVQAISSNILPYTGTTPLWHTETAPNAAFGDSRNLEAEAFGVAWYGHLFAHLGPLSPLLTDLFQFEYVDSPTFGLIAEPGTPVPGASAGNPYLPYWSISEINRNFPRGSKLLPVSNVGSGLDVVAALVAPDFTTVHVLVVNHQPATTCCAGVTLTPTIALSGLVSTSASQTIVDATTNLVSGPSTTNLGALGTVNLTMTGYSVAVLEFKTTLVNTQPTVGSVAPSTGPAAGGTSVTITGTNLTGATAVMFGGTAAATFTVNSATSITATSPAGSGTVDVTVTTPSGTSATSAADKFTYVLVCSAATTPVAVSASSTSQYSLAGSDGASWQEIDAGNLRLACAPTATQSLLLSANADLWTANAGFNQDLGIFVSDNGGADQLLAWKESGGFAGTFSPNAAYVQSLFNMTSGHTYVFKLKWKTNKPAGGATIFAGAGGGTFSPTSLIAEAFPSAPNFAVSTQQYTLANSNGASWQTIDATNLSTTLSPGANATAVLGANADLWTANAGFNQDLGIFVSDNGGADTLVAWKESGGFAGTFSPNAAFVKATYAMTGGHTYVFKLKWKTNKSGSSTIVIGAGPLASLFSPTSLFAESIPGGPNPYSAVSTSQYSLANSDGATWQAIDAALNVTITPGANSNVILGANADLWTANAGFNQDLGIFVSDNGGADTLVAWKESGGFAGTFSPNAAFAQALYPMSSGHTYVFKLKWKTNKNAPGATVYAAAGGPAPFSPTRLTVELTN